MKSFRRDAKTNDLLVNSIGGIEVVDGPQAVGSSLDAIVKTVKGELWYDTMRGIPYFDTVFKGIVSLPEWELSVSEAIQSHPDVDEIVSLSTNVDKDNGVLSYRAEVTVDGQGSVIVSNEISKRWNVVSDDVLICRGMTNAEKIAAVQKELEEHISRLYLDEATGRYYPYKYDESTGRMVPDFEHPVGTYVDIAYTYWQKIAQLTYADASQFVIFVSDGDSHSVGVSVRDGGDVSIKWGDGSSTKATGLSYAQYSHVYEEGGYFVISIVGDINRCTCNFEDDTEQASEETDASGVVALLTYSSYVRSICGYAKNAASAVGDITNVGMMSFCTNLNSAFYGCAKIVGKIPQVFDGTTDCSHAYQGCVGLELGNDVDLDADKLMPTSVTSHANYVTGCSFGVRKRFFSSWGGSSGWTGEVYDSNNAPVTSLVGERIYDPVKNTNSFEITIESDDYSGGSFTFKMRIRGSQTSPVRVDWGDGSSNTYDANTINSLTSVSHVYSSTGETTRDKYVISIDSGALSFSIGENDSDTASRGVVTRVLSWSNTVTGDANAVFFSGCTSLVGTIPAWGPLMSSAIECYKGCNLLQGSVPQWTMELSVVRDCFNGCSGLSGEIPRWKIVSSMSVGGVYKNCSSLTVWPEATYAELMPLNFNVGSDQSDLPVSGATLLKQNFYTYWGGSVETPCVLVTFNTPYGATPINTQSVPLSSTASRPVPDPSKPGYTFINWYSDQELTTEFVFSTPIYVNTTVYSKFTVNTYTVTFNTLGGSSVESQTVNYGECATSPETNPNKEYSLFEGWYSDSELTHKYDFNTPITDNVTLYARFISYLKFTSNNTSEGSARIAFNLVVNDQNYGLSVLYKKNTETQWTTITLNSSNQTEYIYLLPGEFMYLKAPDTGNPCICKDGYNYLYINVSLSPVVVSGTPMSLLNGDMLVDEVGSFGCFRLFLGTSSKVLNLVEFSSDDGFYLPAMKIGDYCYSDMFKNCDLKGDGCKILLPATELKDSCYYAMFYGTSFSGSVVLSAESLVQYCYYQMFANSSDFASIETHHMSWNREQLSTSYWMEGVASQGTFVCPEELSTSIRGVSWCPNNWTVSHIFT